MSKANVDYIAANEMSSLSSPRSSAIIGITGKTSATPQKAGEGELSDEQLDGISGGRQVQF